MAQTNHRRRTLLKSLRRRTQKRAQLALKTGPESLEDRRLLAIGPELIAVQPNAGSLIQENDALHVAPQQLTLIFDDGQIIDQSSLQTGIQITRAGGDGMFGQANDLIVTPGYLAVDPEQPNDVIVRFAETPVDDRYRLEIFGAGTNVLRNTSGDVFNDGQDLSLEFEMDLGAQVIAVVPQPISRDADTGELTQSENSIVVYFNDDDLNAASATNPNFYRLIKTNDTVVTEDDLEFTPSSIVYDPVADTATLTFANDTGILSGGPGTYRLRIGTDESPRLPVPLEITLDATSDPALDPGETYLTAFDLGTLSDQSQIISSAIDPRSFPLEFPGTSSEPGHRDNPAGAHYLAEGSLDFPSVVDVADAQLGINTIAYNFQDDYGFDPQGFPLHNLITEAEKNLTRHIFDVYGYLLGAQFIETAAEGFTVVTGDLRALGPTTPTGPGGVIGLAGTNLDTGKILAIMDAAEDWHVELVSQGGLQGPSWYDTAMHEIGHLLGLGHTYELAPFTVMGDNLALASSTPTEDIFPGDNDLVHALHLHAPESIDVDLYQFDLSRTGVLRAETIAERLADSSMLDSVINVYGLGSDGTFQRIASNDDYFSEDAFVELVLTPGTYFVGVSSTGNSDYDPRIPGTSFGGTTDGPYQLRLDFRPNATTTIVDTTGTPFDGDADGVPGGVYNYWFRVQDADHTLFVDIAGRVPSDLPSGDGTLSDPFNNLQTALAAAAPDDIVRVLGNGGADGDLGTLEDNVAYEIGTDVFANVLTDGARVEVPRGVSLVIDEGAILKVRNAAVLTGSTSPSVDRSAATLQVLGTPEHNVIFTSYDDEGVGLDSNPLTTTPSEGNWGGLVFSNELDRAEGRFDYEDEGIFLNYVGQADLRYAGGSIELASVIQPVAAIDLRDSRPTLAYNTITNSADAAIAATPNSFEETNFHAPEFQETPFTSDYRRIGPNIRGNHLIDNSINGLFIRLTTPAGNELRKLTVAGRWDDNDIVHVVAENLLVDGNPGGPIGTGVAAPPGSSIVDRMQLDAREDARLAIDPGVIVKLDGSRIEVMTSAQLIAEGTQEQQVVFTSILDDRFGAGGTFETKVDDDPLSEPQPGDWGGIYVAYTASLNLDQALVTYAGGVTGIEGTFSAFNAIEIHRADARIVNSTFQFNADGVGGQSPSDANSRNGRGTNAEGVIFVRGAQPVIVNNAFLDNSVRADDNGGTMNPVININVNALNSRRVIDSGRATGRLNAFSTVVDNQGPLVHGNTLASNDMNGMVVRGGTLTTESVWDDTDIVHVLLDEVVVPEFHSYGGLRLESSPAESLVVKLSGFNAGFTATGVPQDIDDRIGGKIQVVGLPLSPVILTSLTDVTVGAGARPNGTPQTNTGGWDLEDPPEPLAGEWRSIQLLEYSHDRNVDVIVENEVTGQSTETGNDTPGTAQVLGALAPREKAGDDNLRLGFQVHGKLRAKNDVDVYSFSAEAGTEVWLDIDKTSSNLDTVVELIDADGNLLARSDNSLAEAEADAIGEQLLVGSSGVTPRILQKSQFQPHDYWSLNPLDAGMRVVLPGGGGSSSTYHVRVRSSSQQLDSDLAGGLSRGAYQLNIRLSDLDEVAGSTIKYADIRYATNGLDIQGLPNHSPLIGEAAETDAVNDTFAEAQPLINALNSNQGTLSIAGHILATDDIDWYQLDIVTSGLQMPDNELAAMIFDIDYADGAANPNLFLSIYDDTGKLVITGDASNVADDVVAPAVGLGGDNLDGGSFGVNDPFIGTVQLPVGTYYVAVTGQNQVPQELHDQFLTANPSNPLIRVEPIDSITRIAEEHLGGGIEAPVLPPQVPQLLDPTAAPVPFHLGDVVLYLSTPGPNNGTSIATVDPFTGFNETFVGSFDRPVFDVTMRDDGFLFGFTVGDGNAPVDDDNAGNYLQIDPNTAVSNNLGDDGIETFINNEDGEPSERAGDDNGVGILFDAITLLGTTGFGVGHRPDDAADGPEYFENILFEFDGVTGEAISQGDPREEDAMEGAYTNIVEIAQIVTEADLGGPGEGPVLLAAAAIDIPDGVTFEAAGTTYEMNTGPVANLELEDGEFVQESPGGVGDRFALDGVTYEFDTGPVLLISGNATSLVDGHSFTLNDRTFELEDLRIGDGVTGTNVAIAFDANTSTAQFSQLVINAINNTGGGGFNVEAIDLSGRVTLKNDTSLALSVPFVGITLDGDYGAAPGNTAIPVEEDMTSGELRIAIRDTFENDIPGITVGLAGTAMNFLGATNGNFDTALFMDPLPGDGAVGPGNIEVGFLINENPNVVANRIAQVLNANGLTAATAADAVTLAGGDIFTNAQTPLRAAGAAPGGRVTGITDIDGLLYMVTDTGGLFTFDFGAGESAFVPTSAELEGIAFSSLTKGPANVENGRYAETLFGVDDGGVLYAFNTDGQLQEVFAGGTSSIDTFVVGAHGMGFSTLDFNMWHVTGDREGDAGHGMEVPVTESRSPDALIPGGASFYFGGGARQVLVGDELEGRPTDEINDIFFPGGAHGSLTTNPIDLSDYSATDEPYLYFNYFLATENNLGNDLGRSPGYNDRTDGVAPPQDFNDQGQNPDHHQDSFRVFISDNDDPTAGTWQLLGTNNSFRLGGILINDEFDMGFGGTAVQELYDSTGTWRQARIPLAAYAGSNNLQLRFDFATAGAMGHLGNIGLTSGFELRSRDGSILRDGETFEVDGTLFEFDLGPTLVLPNSSEIADGELLTIDDGVATPLTFEFDTDGAFDPAHQQIPVKGTESSAGLALAVQQILRDSPLFGAFTLTVTDGANIVLGDTVVADAGGVQTPFEYGFDIPVDPLMTEAEVAQVTADTIAGATGATFEFSGLNNKIITFRGLDNLTSPLAESVTARETLSTASVIGNRLNLEGDLVAVTQTPAPGTSDPRVFLDGAVGAAVGVPVVITQQMSSQEVADQIIVAMAPELTNGVTDVIKRYQDVIRLHAVNFVTPGPLGLTEFMPGDYIGDSPAFGAPMGSFVDSGGQGQYAPGPPRSLNNQVEGVYIDDLIVGFAERGELIREATTANTGFVANTALPADQILVGDYQLEIRRGTRYGLPQTSIPNLFVLKSFDTNQRLSQSVALIAPNGAEIAPDDQFVITDGGPDLVFKYVDRTIIEDNDLAATAFETGIQGGDDETYIGIGQISDNNTLGEGLDVDMVSMTLAAGDRIEIDVDGVGTLLEPGEVVTYLRLFGPGEMEVANSGGQASPSEPPTWDPFLFYEVPEGEEGVYFLGISGHDELLFPNADYDPFLGLPGTTPVLLTDDYRVEITVNAGATPTTDYLPVDYATFDDAEAVADRIVDTINGNIGQDLMGLEITASSLPGSDRVELFGPATVPGGIPLEVTETTTDANALRDVLMGDGIIPVGDAILVSGPTSAGFFEKGESSIKLTTGILLSTGDANVAAGPNLFDDSSGFASLLGDADLDAEFDVVTEDTTSLEFSFVTDTGDLYFSFVFASEEYNEFANTIFNDVFAFFVDGENIALLPGTDVPITINTINGGNPLGESPINSIYYVNNAPADNGRFLEEFGFDGFTRVLTAVKTGLAPGVHTIKLAISDVGDGSLDSAVFLQAGSFASEASLSPNIDTDVNDGVLGDANTTRPQGQLLVHSNVIRDASEFGIRIDAGLRNDQNAADLPNPGPARNLLTPNTAEFIPGVTITNNVVAANGLGAISFSGDANLGTGPGAPVPFGRIINNTLYGRGGDNADFGDPAIDVGVLVQDNASPTLMNNIIANFTDPLTISIDSSSTVVAGTLYKDNLNEPSLLLGDFDINLDAPGSTNTQLFINADAGNFYLEAGSQAIDSAIDAIQDRTEMVQVRTPIGIADSPILAPELDQSGQARVDDPSVDSPASLGENVFNDRGALDRADFIGPQAVMLIPADNDSEGADLDPRQTFIRLRNFPDSFVVQLQDSGEFANALGGVGIDDLTVDASVVEFTLDGDLLAQGTDYRFDYDSTNDQILISPQAGIFMAGTYTITIDNQVQDLAGNPLRPNQPDSSTSFEIVLDDSQILDFGDAPDSYLTTLANDGARHLLSNDLRLGVLVEDELDGQPSVGADGDGDEEDGVIFDSELVVGRDDNLIAVTSSGIGRLDAWIDFNGNGVFGDVGEQIVNSQTIVGGATPIAFSIPSDAVGGDTYARFRLSSNGNQLPTGVAADGEVEDYTVTLTVNHWHNPRDPLDVNDIDGLSPTDVVAVINELDNPTFSDPITGALPIPDGTFAPPPYVDVNNDGFISPTDVLAVITALPSSSSAAATAVSSPLSAALVAELVQPEALLASSNLPSDRPLPRILDRPHDRPIFVDTASAVQLPRYEFLPTPGRYDFFDRLGTERRAPQLGDGLDDLAQELDRELATAESRDRIFADWS